MESFNIKDLGMFHYQILKEHILRLRRLKGMEAATVVIAIENNYGNEAMHHEANLREMGISNMCILRETLHGRAGVLTTNVSKRTMTVCLNQYLIANKIHFHKKMVVVHLKNADERPKAARKRLRGMYVEQLMGFYRTVLQPSNVYGRAREFFSGKNSGKDDLIMGSYVAIEGKILFFLSPGRYSPFYAEDAPAAHMLLPAGFDVDARTNRLATTLSR
jgi:hypothetical protein